MLWCNVNARIRLIKIQQEWNTCGPPHLYCMWRWWRRKAKGSSSDEWINAWPWLNAWITWNLRCCCCCCCCCFGQQKVEAINNEHQANEFTRLHSAGRQTKWQHCSSHQHHRRFSLKATTWQNRVNVQCTAQLSCQLLAYCCLYNWLYQYHSACYSGSQGLVGCRGLPIVEARKMLIKMLSCWTIMIKNISSLKLWWHSFPCSSTVALRFRQ